MKIRPLIGRLIRIGGRLHVNPRVNQPSERSHGLRIRHALRRSFSQLVEVEPKHCAVKMGIICQNLTNHSISQNRDIGL